MNDCGPFPVYPPMTYVSPFISNIEKLESAFGNGGPSEEKEKKNNKKSNAFVLDKYSTRANQKNFAFCI